MEYDTLLRISAVMSIATFVLLFVEVWYTSAVFPTYEKMLHTVILLLGPLATGLVLSKRLKKASWEVPLGIFLTLLISVLLDSFINLI